MSPIKPWMGDPPLLSELVFSVADGDLPGSGQCFSQQFTVRELGVLNALKHVQWSPWCWMAWSGSRPTSFHLSPNSFHLSPTFLHCLPSWVPCGRVPGQLVSNFLSFVLHFLHLSPRVLAVRFPAGLSPTSFHLSPRLGACGRVHPFCRPCSISIHLSATSVTAGVRPFPLAM